MKKITMDWLAKYQLHIVLWLAFIAYETVFVWLIFGASGNLALYTVHYTLAVLFFYTQANYVLPLTLKSTKYSYLTTSFMLMMEMGVFVVLSFFGDKVLFFLHLIPPSKTFAWNLAYCLKTIYRGILFLGASTGYYYVIRYNAEKRRSEELERVRLNNIIQQQKSEQELMKAQNAYLKAQINPHFLFNTLDFIYHNVVSLSPSIGEAIVTLADMMRYAIDADKQGDFIALATEIEQIEHFLYLNQIRKKDGLFIKLTFDDEVTDIKFIPLVLLTLVENIFKHGDLSRREDCALIHIYIRDEMFYIETDNLIDKKSKPESSNTGLVNIQKRLSYAYGESITFRCNEDNRQHFVVSIVIPLNLLKG